MSTYQVPGYRRENQDALHAGCWAEHEDGGRVFVDAVVNDLVTYIVFNGDHASTGVRKELPLLDFMRTFSDGQNGDLWLWHDKTKFALVSMAGYSPAAQRLLAA